MKKLLLLLLLPALQSTAQDLTGIWRGTFYSTKLESMFGSDNKYEIQIDNAGKVCKGVTYSYQNTSFYGKASLVGMWAKSSKNLIFKEDVLMDYKTEDDEASVYMFTCYLEYRKEGDKEILEGDYTSEHFKNHRAGGSGKIYLERVTTTDFKKEDFILKKEREEFRVKPDSAKKLVKRTLPTRKPVVTNPKPVAKAPVIAKAAPKTPAKTPVKTTPPIAKATPKPKPVIVKKPPVVASPPLERPKINIVKSEPIKKPEPVKPVELPQIFKERKNELVQTILTPGPEILIQLYDNGEIDGDTITIFQNGRQIAYRKGLSTEPITIRLKIDEDNPEQEITMVAENLGAIPPNTALMIVKCAGKRYDLRISSSDKNNAVVKFKYQKE